MDMIKDRKVQQLADDILGAAQALDRCARRLKDKAKAFRLEGVHRCDGGVDAIDHQRMFASHDVKEGATQALKALGVFTDNDYLRDGQYVPMLSALLTDDDSPF